MKLNFWQWIGVVLLIVGVVWWIARERNEANPDKTQKNQQQQRQNTAPNPAPAPTQPAATQPG